MSYIIYCKCWNQGHSVNPRNILCLNICTLMSFIPNGSNVCDERVPHFENLWDSGAFCYFHGREMLLVEVYSQWHLSPTSNLYTNLEMKKKTRTRGPRPANLQGLKAINLQVCQKETASLHMNCIEPCTVAGQEQNTRICPAWCWPTSLAVTANTCNMTKSLALLPPWRSKYWKEATSINRSSTSLEVKRYAESAFERPQILGVGKLLLENISQPWRRNWYSLWRPGRFMIWRKVTANDGSDRARLPDRSNSLPWHKSFKNSSWKEKFKASWIASSWRSCDVKM